jgi:surface carbohydrate biosynthesis protein
MIVRIKKVFFYFNYFWHAKKCWSWPRKSQVLIFDSCGESLLMEYLKPWKPEVFHVRGEQINIPVLLLSLLKPGKKSAIYTDCFIAKVKPRLIVTFIDNNFNFYTLAKRHPQVKTLFIQNGIRSFFYDLEDFALMNGSELKVSYMLTFGSEIGEAYRKYIAGTVLPIGSLKNNLIPISQSVKKDVIAFISQWHEYDFSFRGVSYSPKSFYEQIDRPIIQFLKNYAKVHNKHLMIIPLNSAITNPRLRSLEELYFKELLEDEPKFLESQGPYPSYQAADKAEILVTIESTLGYEAIARGKKTAMFSTRSTVLGLEGNNFGYPGKYADEGLFWTNNSDPAAFNRIIDYLFNVSHEEWSKDLSKSRFSSLMQRDPNNSIFKSILEKELAPPKV